MKIRLVLPVAAFLLSPVLRGAEPAAPSEPDFSAFKTADDFWKQIEKLQQQPTERPKTREESLNQIREWFGTQQAAAEAFVKAFPTDERRWQARMIALRSGIQLRRFAGEPGNPDADRQKLEEIINAPDAPATTKGDDAHRRVCG